MVFSSATTSFRPRGSGSFTGAAWVVIAGLVAGEGLQHGAGAAFRAVPYAAAAGVLAWVLCWHPRVDVREDGVRVVNPWRTITVPWEALVLVTTRYALTLVTPHGRYSAWAAPAPGRHSVFLAGDNDLRGLPRGTFDSRRAVGLGDLPSSGSGGAAALVRARWERLVETEALETGIADITPVTVRWHTTTVVVVVGLLIAGAIVQWVTT
jgi:hypothetical protein